jgi:hypothetical protein
MKINLADPYRHVVSTDRYLLLWQEEEVTKQKQMGPSLSTKEFEDAQPVRAGHSYQHRRHYEGMYPVISTGQAVWYESMLELQCLMQLEHAGDLAGISTQPFCLVGPDRFRHYPDFLSRDGFSGGSVVPLRRSPRRCGDDSGRPRTRLGVQVRSLRAGGGD